MIAALTIGTCDEGHVGERRRRRRHVGSSQKAPGSRSRTSSTMRWRPSSICALDGMVDHRRPLVVQTGQS
jgi:hypothetical protein